MLGWAPRFRDSRVASVRYRCLLPLAELRGRGLPAELFDPAKLRDYGVVVFSKRYGDEDYALAREVKRRGGSVVFDICDNHFYNPYSLPEFRRIRGELVRMIGVADVTVASTEALAEVVKQEAGLERAPEVIGDPIEQTAPEVAQEEGGADAAELLWFGIHGGDNAPYGMLDLLRCRELFRDIARRRPIRLTVMSNSRPKYDAHIRPFEVATRYVEWGDVGLPALLARSDAVVIPITRNPFTLCKSNNRPATALFAGVPVVADGIPSYRDLSEFCVLDDWEAGLEAILAHPAEARRRAAAARPYIEGRYAIRRIGDRWESVLRPLLR